MTSMTEYIDPAEQAAIDAAGEAMLFDAEIDAITAALEELTEEQLHAVRVLVDLFAR